MESFAPHGGKKIEATFAGKVGERPETDIWHCNKDYGDDRWETERSAPEPGSGAWGLLLW